MNYLNILTTNDIQASHIKEIFDNMNILCMCYLLNNQHDMIVCESISDEAGVISVDEMK